MGAGEGWGPGPGDVLGGGRDAGSTGGGCPGSDTCGAGSGPCCADSGLASCGSCPLFGLSLVTLDPGSLLVPGVCGLWPGQWVDRQSDPFCPSFTPLSTASGHSKTNEDLKQENSELQEKLRVLVTDKEAAQLSLEELQRKLEMSELLLQQVRA